MTEEVVIQAPAPTPNAGGNSGTFTQEQLNQIVSDRAKRAEEAAVKKLLEGLGVQSADEIKAILDAKKLADEASKTELQKQADRATAAEAESAKLKQEHSAQIAVFGKRLLDAEIKQAASRPVEKDGKVSRPAFRVEALDDILVLLDRTGIDEKDGKYEGIEKALETLAKQKPYLLADGKAANQLKGTPNPGEIKPPAASQAPAARPRVSL